MIMIILINLFFIIFKSINVVVIVFEICLLFQIFEVPVGSLAKTCFLPVFGGRRKTLFFTTFWPFFHVSIFYNNFVNFYKIFTFFAKNVKKKKCFF